METKRLNRIIGAWTNVCRFALAAVFIFSGFVKAVDPLGFQYKIQDYLQAFGMAGWFPSFFPLFAAILLSTLEFSVGVYFLFGIRRKLSTALVLIMMIFMTPFTLYLAIANPVSDCGCFGDAWVLTNVETFIKNIFLLLAAVSVFKWGNRIARLVSESSQWLIALYSLIFIIGVSLYCFTYLPVIDFRPYKIGTDIPKSIAIPEGAKKSVYESTFILEKGGVKKEFTLDNYPDSTWTFVDAHTVLKEKGYDPPIHDFSIVKTDDGKDITEEVLDDKNYTFLLIAHKIGQADDSHIDLINEIYDYCVENGYKFYCLTSSLDKEIGQWRDKTGAEYPFCITDDTTLKTIIRSNPGLLLIKGGIILNKWSHNELPDEYALTGKLDKLPIGKKQPRVLSHTMGAIFLWFAIPLLIFLGIDILVVKRLDRRKKKKTKNTE